MSGNAFYTAGHIYTVGNFINERYFELMTGINDECWYSEVDEEGIHVSFKDIADEYQNAWFDKIEKKKRA
ncbi:hypothetical protein [Psychrobacter glacincola]|uniref:hypothetical protein n=1 Tax=Psychrobacter glacincola TaxID=56810 RepID=UPI0039B006B4